jgi:Trypsin
VDAGFINDISILKMNAPVIFSDYVRPICLPLPGTYPKDGTMCTVVGWGQLYEVGRIFR